MQCRTRLGTTTTSEDLGKSDLFLLNTSRITRLTRFLATLPPNFLLTAIPSRVLPFLPGCTRISRLLVSCFLPRFWTRTNSARFNKRTLFPKASSEQPLRPLGLLVGRCLDGEACATLPPAPLEDFLAATGSHPGEKPVCSLSLASTGLVGTLQDRSPLSLRCTHGRQFEPQHSSSVKNCLRKTRTVNCTGILAFSARFFFLENRSRLCYPYSSLRSVPREAPV